MTGLLLGFALILPIGAQNVFVVGQGLSAGWTRACWAAVAAGCCDTLLIITGAAGASGLLTVIPAVRMVMLAAGAVFLGYLGIRAWRSAESGLGRDPDSPALAPVAVIRRTIAVSLLNPHAILDTVGVIGAAVAAQPAAHRISFATGTASASWLWFFLLAAGAAWSRRLLTPRRALWFERISGTVMIAFGLVFAWQLVGFLR